MFFKVSMTTSATERRSQLILLQESLIKLEDYKVNKNVDYLIFFIFII